MFRNVIEAITYALFPLLVLLMLLTSGRETMRAGAGAFGSAAGVPDPFRNRRQSN